ncbi:nucleotide sugar dehydrogenase [archaeon]|nr:nucleotide sugar dehydrogenase [archaeon]MBT4022063.1 nucleotide sugar dehydrogenase [archaeon]MBT4272676.1 nucleotide sugar dehydrogenase [archaeon]MBT4461474.1 nucleotide sugar dehydrogenase [archaeon]MBT4857756.1 nucleotide sugar dehydrogenase [archaeon]
MNKICVIGLGRVGLPLSLSFANKGFEVHGIDINENLISDLNKGKMPFIEKNADPLLKKTLNEKFFPSSNFSVLKKVDTIILTLGTPVDAHLNPSYDQIDSVFPHIIECIKKNQLIILRSTVAPGTTNLLKDRIERKSGLKCGKDFFMAFCPERIAEGNAIAEIKEVPQIIGGIDKISSDKAKEIFSNITDSCITSDAKSVELAKILTNMYRYINFAIANEFAILAMENNRNIYEILNLINKDYKRGGVPQPGFTAGPCLYKDGFFLLNNIPFNELISVSWRINENLPLYLLEKIKKITSLKGKKVTILGMTFKKNIDDTRNSLSFKLKKAFLREQSIVFTHDPYLDEHKFHLDKKLKNADVVVIAMNHDVYKKLDKKSLKKYVAKKCIICDVWNLANNGRIIYKI